MTRRPWPGPARDMEKKGGGERDEGRNSDIVDDERLKVVLDNDGVRDDEN